MNTEIFENYQDFCNRSDKTLNGVSAEFARRNPNFKKDNKTNEGCWNCLNCRACLNCSDCSEMTGKKNKNN